MKYLKSIYSIVAIAALFFSCDSEFLERYPLDQVTQPYYFKKTVDLQIYMNRFYTDGVFPVMTQDTRATENSAHDISSDAVVGQEYSQRLAGTRSISSAGSWDYSDIRSVNYFLEHYEACEDPFDNYKHYVGEAYFFRALLYFLRLRNFGDIPYVSTVLTTSSPELFDPRTPRNVVVDNILADLDKAVTYLRDAKGTGYERINKWVALLLQSRVALFEGAWEKYHAGTAFAPTASNPNKYFTKAAEAAEAVINSGVYSVYTGAGDPDENYYRLFGQRDYNGNSEVMFWKKYDIVSGPTGTCMPYFNECPVNRGITKAIADLYLCKDGKPIGVSPLFDKSTDYETLTLEAKNRDSRFFQTIFTPEAIWLDYSNTGGVIQYWQDLYARMNSNAREYAPTGYCFRKLYNEDMRYHTPQSASDDTPLIIYRYAEVLLNYAEAKAELGATQADMDKSINKLRDRVGMPHLQIDDIATDPDWVFPNLSPLINEVRRERAIELINEGFRIYDILRWAAAKELVIGKRPKGAKAAQFPAQYMNWTVDADGFLDPWQIALPNGFQFNPNRDYLNPVAEHQINLNNKIVQNPGW